MSETTTVERPWHGAGAANPLDSLHDWIVAEFAKKGGASPEVKAIEARVAALESENAALKAKEQKVASDLNDSPPVTSAYTPPASDYASPSVTSGGISSDA